MAEIMAWLQNHYCFDAATMNKVAAELSASFCSAPKGMTVTEFLNAVQYAAFMGNA